MTPPHPSWLPSQDPLDTSLSLPVFLSCLGSSLLYKYTEDHIVASKPRGIPSFNPDHIVPIVNHRQTKQGTAKRDDEPEGVQLSSP